MPSYFGERNDDDRNQKKQKTKDAVIRQENQKNKRMRNETSKQEKRQKALTRTKTENKSSKQVIRLSEVNKSVILGRTNVEETTSSILNEVGKSVLSVELMSAKLSATADSIAIIRK